MAGWQELRTTIVKMPPATEGSSPTPAVWCGLRLQGVKALTRDPEPGSLVLSSSRPCFASCLSLAMYRGVT